jgi:methionyl-tRNA formyltransferase
MTSRRILYLGSDYISSTCLNNFLRLASNVECQILTPTNKSLLSSYAVSKGLNTWIPANKALPMEQWDILSDNSELSKQQFDFLVVASFGYLVPGSFISRFPAALNVHPSLLPKYQGASPIPYTLINQDREAGVSIIELHPTAFDKGDILLQKKIEGVDITEATYETLSHDLAVLAGKMLYETIVNYPTLKTQKWSQDKSAVIKAPKLKAGDFKLDFNTGSESFYARYRGLKGTASHSYFMFRNSRILPTHVRRVTSEELEILNTRYPSARPGTIWVIYPGLTKLTKISTKFFAKVDDVIYIKCNPGWIALEDFVIEGKQKTPTQIRDFLGSYINRNLYTSMSDSTTEPGFDLKFE